MVKKTPRKYLKEVKNQAIQHGTPLFVIDHNKIRTNYQTFSKYLPKVKIYYAVKANSDPGILKTLFEMGSGFDVASREEFDLVFENIQELTLSEQREWIFDHIIYANPIKKTETLEFLNKFKPLMTYDNSEEIKKIKKHCPHARLCLRIRVPNTGSTTELSSKFGAEPALAVDLILKAKKLGLNTEGVSFHVGSQCVNFENYVAALQLTAEVFKEAKARGHELKMVDIGGGFPFRYHDSVKAFSFLAKEIRDDIKRLFAKDIQIIAEPGRFIVADAGILVAKVIGKTVRDGRMCYYIDDGVYHTFSGEIFDHRAYSVHAFKKGRKKMSTVFGPTCDSVDKISSSVELPELKLGDLVYSEHIGAYSITASTHFNGFPPARVAYLDTGIVS